MKLSLRFLFRRSVGGALALVLNACSAADGTPANETDQALAASPVIRVKLVGGLDQRPGSNASAQGVACVECVFQRDEGAVCSGDQIERFVHSYPVAAGVDPRNASAAVKIIAADAQQSIDARQAVHNLDAKPPAIATACGYLRCSVRRTAPETCSDDFVTTPDRTVSTKERNNKERTANGKVEIAPGRWCAEGRGCSGPLGAACDGRFVTAQSSAPGGGVSVATCRIRDRVCAFVVGQGDRERPVDDGTVCTAPEKSGSSVAGR